MTAPTPQERLWAEVGGGSVLPELMRADIEASLTALAAVTAERDQARQMLESERSAAFKLAETTALTGMQARDVLEALGLLRELEAARQMLADAPHAYGVGGYWCTAGLEPAICTCWKAGL